MEKAAWSQRALPCDVVIFGSSSHDPYIRAACMTEICVTTTLQDSRMIVSWNTTCGPKVYWGPRRRTTLIVNFRLKHLTVLQCQLAWKPHKSGKAAGIDGIQPDICKMEEQHSVSNSRDSSSSAGSRENSNKISVKQSFNNKVKVWLLQLSWDNPSLNRWQN